MMKRSMDVVIDQLRTIVTAHLPAGWGMDPADSAVVETLVLPCQVMMALRPASRDDQVIRVTFTLSPACRLTGLSVDARLGGREFSTAYATGLPHLAVCLPAPRRLEIDLRTGLALALRSLSEPPGWTTDADDGHDVPAPPAPSATRVVVGCLVAEAFSRLSQNDRQRVRNLPRYGALIFVADCPTGLGDDVAAAIAGASGMSMVSFGRWDSRPSLPGLAHADLRPRG